MLHFPPKIAETVIGNTIEAYIEAYTLLHIKLNWTAHEGWLHQIVTLFVE